MVDNNMYSKQRKIYIDVLRIIACYLVIFNHTNERGFYKYAADTVFSEKFFVHVILSTVCKVAVPIFFMISGAMLLDKEESISRTFRRIPRILAAIVIFNALYFWTDTVIGYKKSVSMIMHAMIQNNFWHLWYLYAYIAFLITLPFLRKFVKGLDLKTSVYFLTVAGITVGFVPIIEYFIENLNMSIKPMWLTANIFLFPVAGYIADKVIDIGMVKKKHLAFLWFLNIGCFIIGALSEGGLLLREPGNTSSETFLQNFCLINAFVLFLTVKFIFYRVTVNELIQRFISETGRITYGIYLLHIWILIEIPILYRFWMQWEQNCVFGSTAGVLVSCLGTFVITGLITWCLRKIPVIKWLF